MNFWLLLVLAAAAQACPGGVVAASRVGVLTYNQSGAQFSAVQVSTKYCSGKIPGAVSLWGNSAKTAEVLRFTEKFLLPEWDRQALTSLTITAVADDYGWVKVNGVEMTPRPERYIPITYNILPFVSGASDDLGWNDNVIEVFGNNSGGEGCVAYSINYSL